MPTVACPAAQAVKLRDSFINIYKKGGVSLSAEKLKEANIGWEDIFEEIPIVVHNSPLVTALMAQARASAALTARHALLTFPMLNARQ